MNGIDEVMRDYLVELEKHEDPGFAGILSAFCANEFAETDGACAAKALRDIAECREAVREEENLTLSHPWYTDSQIAVLRAYCGGENSWMLIEKNDHRHMTELNGDGLLACMLAACDERIECGERDELFGEMEALAEELFARLGEQNSPTP